jgi:hypothetical protein
MPTCHARQHCNLEHRKRNNDDDRPDLGQQLVIANTTAVPPTLSVNDVIVTEGDTGSTNAVFTVTLSSASADAVSVDYISSNGTATTPGDYQTVSGALTFAPGQTTRNIIVPVNGDTSTESNETFFVTLSNPTSAALADAQGQGTITDDDAAQPTFSLSQLTERSSALTRRRPSSSRSSFRRRAGSWSASTGQPITGAFC